MLLEGGNASFELCRRNHAFLGEKVVGKCACKSVHCKLACVMQVRTVISKQEAVITRSKCSCCFLMCKKKIENIPNFSIKSGDSFILKSEASCVPYAKCICSLQVWDSDVGI